MHVNRAEIDELRRAFTSIPDDAGMREDCPSPDQIWETAKGQMPAGAAREVVDHVANCPTCTEAWRLAQSIEAPGSVEQNRPSTSSRFSRGWMAVAAAILLMAVGLGTWSIQDSFFKPVYRDHRPYDIQSLVSDQEALPRDDFRLRWSVKPPAPDTVRFDVDVTLVTGDDILIVSRARNLDRAEYVVAESDLADVPSGATLSWKITAHFPQSAETESLTFRNRLK